MPVPSVSIVLPTYNGARYLAQSVRSCLEQTYRDLELIIVDDCSTDATPQIIAELAASDPRVRTIRHPTNRRLPGSLNTGFSLSRGRYLTWTSDDNVYRLNALADLVRVLDQECDVGLVYARMTNIDPSGRPLGPSFSGGPPDELAFGSPVGACFLYRRGVYEAIGGYSEDLFLVEDWDYWVRIAERFRLRALPEDLYLLRIHEGSLSSQRQESHRVASRTLLERHLPNMHWASRAARAHGYLLAARLAWNAADRRKALHHIALAAFYSPTYALRRIAGDPFDWVLKRRRHRRRAPIARQEEENPVPFEK